MDFEEVKNYLQEKLKTMTKQNELDDLKKQFEDCGIESLIKRQSEFECIKNFIKEEKMKPKIRNKKVFNKLKKIIKNNSEKDFGSFVELFITDTTFWIQPKIITNEKLDEYSKCYKIYKFHNFYGKFKRFVKIFEPEL